MHQNYTSANTSINSKKLPAVYKLLPQIVNDFKLGGRVMVDYGCGKYTGHLKEAANAAGLTWAGYDKYNQSEEFNRGAARAYYDDVVSLTVCSNVLNVIDDDETIAAIVRFIVDGSRVAVFTVYEGDRSGVGKATKADCYQRNEKLKDYMRFFDGRALGASMITTWKNCIIVQKYGERN